MFKQTLCALALVASAATAQADMLLFQEDFDDAGALPASGWVLTNASTPIGLTGWFQGDQNVFNAQQGAPQAYVAANYNNGAVGGKINNWLISPEFSTATNVVISFWARAADDPGYSDLLAYGTSSGGSALGDFTLGSTFVAPTDAWTRYSLLIDQRGAGSVARFAIQYSGDADASSYVGIDTFVVNSVPEPAGVLLLAGGLLGLAALRGRKQV